MSADVTAGTAKRSGLTRVAIAYVIAIAVGLAWLTLGPSTDRLWLDTLVADLLATLVIFGASRMHRNSSFYDAYWSVIPPLIVLWWWVERAPGADGWRFVLLFVVMVLWAVRLTANWAYTFPGLHHEDWRYPLLRSRAPKAEAAIDLTAIHVIPTLQVFAALLPAYVLTQTTSHADLNALDILALVVGLGAVALELAADTQLHRFARTKQPGQVLDTGLWAWSRHPNYVGELSFWVSIALFGYAAAPDQWWQGVGALLMLAMFQGASIPMMEERSLQRRPEYADVVARVSRFLPRPPRARTPEGS